MGGGGGGGAWPVLSEILLPSPTLALPWFYEKKDLAGCKAADGHPFQPSHSLL